MKKYGILMVAGLLALSAAFTDVRATATTSTTTTVQKTDTPTATTTTTKTTVQPTARDAITGEPVDVPAPPVKEEEKKSLRDEVREKIKEETRAE